MQKIKLPDKMENKLSTQAELLPRDTMETLKSQRKPARTMEYELPDDS